MDWAPGLSQQDRERIWQHLKKHPAIPALKRVEDVDIAHHYRAKLVFFLTGTLYDLRDVCARGECLGMQVFCHLDLVQGIGKDPAGIKWLATEIGVRGILTTRSTLIRAAKSEGLMAIQRLFMLDSESLKTGLEIIASSRPDAVEILPALVVPSMAHRLPMDRIPPFIAGGLVETIAEIESIMASGALGVSTSKQELWAYERA